MADGFSIHIKDGHGGVRDIGQEVRGIVDADTAVLGKLVRPPNVDEIAAKVGYSAGTSLVDAARRSGYTNREQFLSAALGAPVVRLEGYYHIAPIEEKGDIDEDEAFEAEEQAAFEDRIPEELPETSRAVSELALELVLQDPDRAEALARAIQHHIDAYAAVVE